MEPDDPELTLVEMENESTFLEGGMAAKSAKEGRENKVMMES